MTEPLPQGTLVRTTRYLVGPNALDAVDRPVGFEFEIEEFVTAGDPASDEIGVDFYYGNARGGINNVVVPADAVEVVRTAEQQRARKLPTRTQIRELLGLWMLADADHLKITETSPDGPVSLEVFGRTDEDLPFGARVVVEQVWRTDD